MRAISIPLEPLGWSSEHGRNHRSKTHYVSLGNQSQRLHGTGIFTDQLGWARPGANVPYSHASPESWSVSLSQFGVRLQSGHRPDGSVGFGGTIIENDVDRCRSQAPGFTDQIEQQNHPANHRVCRPSLHPNSPKFTAPRSPKAPPGVLNPACGDDPRPRRRRVRA